MFWCESFFLLTSVERTEVVVADPEVETTSTFHTQPFNNPMELMAFPNNNEGLWILQSGLQQLQQADFPVDRFSIDDSGTTSPPGCATAAKDDDLPVIAVGPVKSNSSSSMPTTKFHSLHRYAPNSPPVAMVTSGTARDAQEVPDFEPRALPPTRMVQEKPLSKKDWTPVSAFSYGDLQDSTGHAATFLQAANLSASPITPKFASSGEQQQQPGKRISKKKASDPFIDTFGEPKRPLNAYNIFFRHYRQELLSIHGKVGFEEMGKSIGAKWKSMGKADRAPFLQMAEQEKKVYKEAMKEYKKRMETLGAPMTRKEAEGIVSVAEKLQKNEVAFLIKAIGKPSSSTSSKRKQESV